MAIFKNAERLKAIEMYSRHAKTYKEIAGKLKVRPNTVSGWINDYKASIEFKEDLKEVMELINNEKSISSLVRIKIDERLKRISEKTKVIHYKFFKKP